MRKTAAIFVLGIFSVTLGTARLHAQETDQAETPKKTEEKAPAQMPDPAEADLTAVPNRPTFASTAEMVPLGVFEVEYGIEAADGHQNINGLLKWGALKNLELWFLNNPMERDAGVVGIGDSGAGFKYKLFSQARVRPTVAVLYVATLPTATSGLGAGTTGHFLNILLSKDFGKHHFDVNEGAQFLGRTGASGFDRRYFSSLSYSHPLLGNWGYSGEIAGFSSANPVPPATMTLLAAGTYNVSSRLVLDCGAYYTVYGQLPRITFFGGVTYSVTNLFRRHTTRRSVKH